MITFFKNQGDIAEGIKVAIDSYWNNSFKEEEFIDYIFQVVENNKELLFKDDDYTTIIKQKLGIKRLNLLNKILKRMEE